MNLANFIKKLQPEKIQIFTIFSFFIFINFTFPYNQIGEMSRYLSLLPVYFIMLLIFKFIIQKIEIKNEETNNKEVQKIYNPEYSWALEKKTTEETNSLFTKQNIFSFITIIYLTFIFILISPIVYNLFNFETYKIYVFNLINFPILLLTYYFFKKNKDKINLNFKYIYTNSFIVFIVLNILSLIFKIQLFGFIFSVFTTLIYIIYYKLFIIDNYEIEEVKKEKLEIRKYKDELIEHIKKINSLFLNKKNVLEFLQQNKNNLFIIFILFIDLIIANINFSNYLNSPFFSFSFLIKLIFIAFIYINYEKISNYFSRDNNKQMFYLNILISKAIFVFLITFIFSFIIVDLFFSSDFYNHHTSFAYIVLSNYILLISIYIFITAKKINNKLTEKMTLIAIIPFVFFITIFSFNSIESFTFFIVGTFTIYSLFVYHLVIKRKNGYFTNLF